MTALENSPNQIGPYQILAELGKGGMSFVYKAIDTRAETQVALKVLPILHADDPAYIRRFVREGLHASRLNHPNIVPVYEAAQYDDYHVIAMELLEGGTLSDYLRGQWDLLKPQIPIGVIKQLADGLDYAHRQGFLHRDIKPSNILLSGDLLDPTTRILISDFGVARRMSSNDVTAVTQTGYTVGTPNFMSPEQAKGDEQINHRSDIYGLGAVAYVLFTGKMPFKADTQLALMHKVVYEPPTPPEEINPDIPPGIAYAIKRVLAKDPNQRYNSALEFAEALREGLAKIPSSGVMAALEASSYPIRVASTKPPKLRKRKSAIVPSLVTLFGATTVLLFMLILPVGQPLRQWLGIELVREEVFSPIILSTYEDPQGHFKVEVPDAWTLTETDGLTTFDSNEFVGRLFVQRQPLEDQPSQADVAQNSINHAQSASATPQTLENILVNYINQPNLPFKNLIPIEDGLLQIQRLNAAEGRYYGSWLGVNVMLRLVAAEAPDGQNAYVLGSVIGAEQEDALGHLTDAVFGSFTMISNATDLVAQANSGGESSNNNNNEENATEGQDMATASSNPSPHPTVTPIAMLELQSPVADAQVVDAQTPSPEPTRTATRNQTATSTKIPTPTATNNGRGTPTQSIAAATVTAVSAQIETPMATITAQPTNRATLAATSTASPTQTQSSTATTVPTATETATMIATPTPSPTQTSTATSTITATASPTSSSTATPTPQLKNSALPTQIFFPTITPTATTAPVSDNASVLLIGPRLSALQGEQNFRWISNVPLRLGQRFELVFWQEGQDPIVNGFGPVGAQVETSLIIDVDELAEMSSLFDPNQSYEWGILLVTESPYRRLRLLGSSPPFRFKLSGEESSPKPAPKPGE